MKNYFKKEVALILAASITISDGADRLYDCLEKIYKYNDKKYARGAAKRLMKKVKNNLVNISEHISKTNRFESDKKPNSRRVLSTKIFDAYSEELKSFKGSLEKGYLDGLPKELALAMVNLIASTDFLKTRKFTKCNEEINDVLKEADKAITLLKKLKIYDF